MEYDESGLDREVRHKNTPSDGWRFVAWLALWGLTIGMMYVGFRLMF